MTRAERPASARAKSTAGSNHRKHRSYIPNIELTPARACCWVEGWAGEAGCCAWDCCAVASAEAGVEAAAAAAGVVAGGWAGSC